MRKIVFLVRNVKGDGFGGGEVYQLRLAKRLIQSGFCPIIITNSRKMSQWARRNEIKVLKPPFLEQQNWSGWRNVLLPRYWFFQKKLKKWYLEVLRKYQPVIVNIQSRDDMIAGTLACKKMGIKVLWTDHADFYNWVLWNVNRRFKNIIGKKIIELSSEVEKVIFVSEKMKEYTTKMIYPKVLNNIAVIENGVEDELAQYDKTKVAKGSFVFIGRVVEEKGIRELVEAFQVVRKKNPEAKLNIYGDGEIERFKAIDGDDEGVKFCGVTHEPLKVLAENEVFVLPSYREGLSLSLIEAAMMEKKIIASDVGGSSEVIKDGETGLLVPAKNEKRLEEAMCWMLSNEREAQRMAHNVRIRYKEKFDFGKIFEEKILPLYNNKKEEEK